MRATRIDTEPIGEIGFEWTPEFWQGWRESENPYRSYKSSRDRELVLKSLQPHDGERVLEVGCGYGWISRALWNAARIEWFGIDRSAEMVRHLRAAPQSKEARASVADATRLPYGDGAFDKVVCTGVLMHIAEDDAAVRELVRVLRPGGLLVCSINNALSPYSLLVRLWNSRKQGFVQKFRIPGLFRRFLRRVGMDVGSMGGDGIIATVPLEIGRLRFPPKKSFATVCRFDAWATSQFAWLAYEVWFASVKAIPPCIS